MNLKKGVDNNLHGLLPIVKLKVEHKKWDILINTFPTSLKYVSDGLF